MLELGKQPMRPWAVNDSSRPDQQPLKDVPALQLGADALGPRVPAADDFGAHLEAGHHLAGLSQVDSRRCTDERPCSLLKQRLRNIVQPWLERSVQGRQVSDAPHVQSKEVVDLVVGNSGRRMEEIGGIPVGKNSQHAPVLHGVFRADPFQMAT